MLFTTAPKIIYDGRSVTDMTSRVNIIQGVLQNKDFTYTIQLEHGMKPEDVAYRFHNNIDLHWLVLMINEIYDPFYEWYMTDQELLEYSKLVYGDPEFQDVKYWIKDGVKYQTDIGNAVAVSNYEWETAENDKRQTIRMVYPEYVDAIVQQFEALVK